MQVASIRQDWTAVPWSKVRWLLRFPWDWPPLAWAWAVTLVNWWEDGPPLTTPEPQEDTDAAALFVLRSALASEGAPTPGEVPLTKLANPELRTAAEAVVRVMRANYKWAEALGVDEG